MLTQEQAVEIRVMARQGKAIREISRYLGISRNTVRRYLREEDAPTYAPRAPRPSGLRRMSGVGHEQSFNRRVAE